MAPSLISLLAYSLPFCAGHSWVEELSVVQGDELTGNPGYARNNGMQSSERKATADCDESSAVVTWMSMCS